MELCVELSWSWSWVFMQIGSNEVTEFYRVNTFKDFVCSRLFIGRPSFTTTMVWTFKSTFVSGIIYICPLPKSLTVIGPTLGPQHHWRHWTNFEKPYSVYLCKAGLFKGHFSGIMWYHLSSSNLKLFLVWTQLWQTGKLFFCIFTLFPQHRTSLDRMQWYALAKPLAYALTMHMALHVVSARNRIRNPGRGKLKQYSTTLQQSTVFPLPGRLLPANRRFLHGVSET